MDNTSRRAKALEKIRANIEAYGYHTYVVTQGVVPRFAYTIGLSDVIGFELVLAGASFFDIAQAREIVRSCGHVLKRDETARTVELEALGRFSFRDVHSTWAPVLLKGARDYYGHDVNVRQIVPDREHITIDVPDMSRPYETRHEPIWCWLTKEWPYPFPRETDALTDISALCGARVTGIRRPEANEWEFLSDPLCDYSDESARMMPLATLLGSDPSLLIALSLDPGTSVWRSDDGWRLWRAGPGSADPLFEPTTLNKPGTDVPM